MNPRVRSARETPFEAFHRGLLHVHGELRGLLRGVLEAPGDGRIETFCQELLDHHKAEDVFLFPGFRAAGRLRSSDVAFFDARDAEHRDLHRLCLALRDVGRAHRRGALSAPDRDAAALRIGQELQALSIHHFAIEESTLTAVHVAEMITERELAAVQREMQRRWTER